MDRRNRDGRVEEQQKEIGCSLSHSGRSHLQRITKNDYKIKNNIFKTSFIWTQYYKSLNREVFKLFGKPITGIVLVPSRLMFHTKSELYPELDYCGLKDLREDQSPNKYKKSRWMRNVNAIRRKKSDAVCFAAVGHICSEFQKVIPI